MVSKIQSILFDRRFWKLTAAKKWCTDHGYKADVDATEHFYRFRQFDPNHELIYRTKKIGHGIEFIIEFGAKA